MNPCIFKFLVEWYPSSLKIGETKRSYYSFEESRTNQTEYDSFLLQEVLYGCFPIETKKAVFKAGLKHFPHDLGLLFKKSYEYGPIIEYLFDENDDESIPWTIIESCFKEIGADNFKPDAPDPNTTKRCACKSSVDLGHSLLKQDPSVLSHFDLGSKRTGTVGGKRKR